MVFCGRRDILMSLGRGIEVNAEFVKFIYWSYVTVMDYSG